MGFQPPPPAQPKQGLAIASLVLGILSVPTLGCLGIGALVAVVLGIMALVKAGREPQRYGGRGFAIGGIVAAGLSLVIAIPLGGIVAAIAIPSLLRARVSANESATIGDIRSVISAQAAYQSANCGAYGPLECLSTPSAPGCIANYPATGPTFLDSTLTAQHLKSGYTRSFHPGNMMALPEPCSSNTGLESFAYTAVPSTRNQTGVRGFCGDSSGRICMTMDGTQPPVTNGQCAEDCRLLN